MTQVFADGDQVATQGLFTRVAHIPAQQGGQVPLAWPGAEPIPLGCSLTPGKGVRRIRCVGCSHDTLPRPDDGAPLCQRCSELLATAGAGIDAFVGSMIFRAPRWLRRRSTLA
jgi:hypothetical protein